jgi:hypothetical protein
LRCGRLTCDGYIEFGKSFPDSACALVRLWVKIRQFGSDLVWQSVF